MAGGFNDHAGSDCLTWNRIRGRSMRRRTDERCAQGKRKKNAQANWHFENTDPRRCAPSVNARDPGKFRIFASACQWDGLSSRPATPDSPEFISNSMGTRQALVPLPEHRHCARFATERRLAVGLPIPQSHLGANSAAPGSSLSRSRCAQYLALKPTESRCSGVSEPLDRFASEHLLDTQAEEARPSGRKPNRDGLTIAGKSVCPGIPRSENPRCFLNHVMQA